MQLILFDDHSRDNLLPLTFTRPVSCLRIGILTIADKWEKAVGEKASHITTDYLSGKYPCLPGEDNLLVNGSLLPNPTLLKAIESLNKGESLLHGETLLAARTGKLETEKFDQTIWMMNGKEYQEGITLVDFPWKIFSLNGQEIESDFQMITKGRKSEVLSESVRVINPENVFVEPGFKGEHFILNASTGPIYLGRDTEIMEGSVIRGPFALCEGSIVKLSAKIYGPTTLGPFSKVGGEINNSVIQGNSNKAHDGYLGNSVIGEWCNLGADTNNSNLKNNYADVKVWNYREKKYINSGRQFCGLIMGDHSKCGINTMFNTGTVVGVSANIFGVGFPRTFIPSFSWGGTNGFTTYRMDKVLETAALVMGRRDLDLSEEDKKILDYIYRYSEQYRNFP